MKIGKWKIRPEINDFKYWIHIVIIAVMVLFGLKILFGLDMLTFDWIWKFSLLIALADIKTHTMLGLD